MATVDYNFDADFSGLIHITDDFEHPVDLFEKWLKEAEENEEINWAKVMSIATIHEKTGVLSRNVLLREFDQSGFTFVTDRNSRKYNDLKNNPLVVATFFWKYKLDGNVTLKQIRINGNVTELAPNEITKFYAKEGLATRIRCKICRSDQSCDWDELKRKHDKVLENIRNGTEKFEQDDRYTAMIINPREMDFYHSFPNFIGDRVKYIKDQNGRWYHHHMCA